MYGTIFRMRPKPGQEQNLIEMFKEWEGERGPNVKGAVAAYLMRPDRRSDEFIGVAVFSDRESYMANAQDPEQDRWYRRLRESLQSDPEWEDGEYIASMSA